MNVSESVRLWWAKTPIMLSSHIVSNSAHIGQLHQSYCVLTLAPRIWDTDTVGFVLLVLNWHAARRAMVTRRTKIKGPLLKKKKKTHYTVADFPLWKHKPLWVGLPTALEQSQCLESLFSCGTAQVLSHDVFTDNAVRVFARAHQQLGNVLLGQINLPLHLCHRVY